MCALKRGFKRSNGQGGIAERFTCDLLTNNGIPCTKDNSEKKLYDHDLVAQLDDQVFTIEVKYDMMSCLTGNIAIEYRNSKKNAASGLFVTKANFWAVLISNKGSKELYISPTQKILNFVLNSDPHKIIESGGDDNADLFLYKKDIILPQFTRISDLSRIGLRNYFYDNLREATSTPNNSP